MKVRRSPLLDVGSRTMVPTLVAVSLFLLVVGHDLPGGGFVGGLLAGAALLVVYLTGGSASVLATLPTRATVLVGTGMAVAAATATLGFVFGAAFLDAGKVTLDLWLLGSVSVGSTLVFDVGVYLVVVGLVAMVLTRAWAEEGEA